MKHDMAVKAGARQTWAARCAKRANGEAMSSSNNDPSVPGTAAVAAPASRQQIVQAVIEHMNGHEPGHVGVVWTCPHPNCLAALSAVSAPHADVDRLRAEITELQRARVADAEIIARWQCEAERYATLFSVSAERPPHVCRDCAMLASFELADDIKTCPTLNIRIHTREIDTFGCNLFEPKELGGEASPLAPPQEPRS
jgi:hypothetical protein